jgi:hypothetical protein
VYSCYIFSEKLLFKKKILPFKTLSITFWNVSMYSKSKDKLRKRIMNCWLSIVWQKVLFIKKCFSFYSFNYYLFFFSILLLNLLLLQTSISYFYVLPALQFARLRFSWTMRICLEEKRDNFWLKNEWKSLTSSYYQRNI